MDLGAETIWTGIVLLLLVAPIVAIVLGLKLRRHRKEIDEIRDRFSAIIDVEEEAAKARTALGEQTRQIEDLRSSYADKRKTYDRLTQELAIYDERLAFAELGVYEPPLRVH